MELERLFPPGGPVTPSDLLATERPWERAPADRPYVLANMIATLDGRADIDGGSTALGGPGDAAMFGALRGSVDAILAGTGTVAVERYGRLAAKAQRRRDRRALGLAGDPLMVLISRSGKLPWDAPLFAADVQPVVVFSTPGRVKPPKGIAAPVELVELEDLSIATALTALRRDHGVRALLCEGGPRLLRAMVAGGLVDELCLTLDPLLAGGDAMRRILAGDELADPVRARLHSVLRHEDELLLRYRLRT